MIRDAKIRQGTKAWFEMVGTLMSEAATRSGLSPDLNVSLVERYTDGVELSAGLIQGIRFDIRDGRPSFRAGVGGPSGPTSSWRSPPRPRVSST